MQSYIFDHHLYLRLALLVQMEPGQLIQYANPVGFLDCVQLSLQKSVQQRHEHQHLKKKSWKSNPSQFDLSNKITKSCAFNHWYTEIKIINGGYEGEWSFSPLTWKNKRLAFLIIFIYVKSFYSDFSIIFFLATFRYFIPSANSMWRHSWIKNFWGGFVHS